MPFYWFKMIGFVLFGFSSLKNSLSYVYLFEFMHSKDKSFACSCINFADVSGAAIAGCFFLFVKKDWFPLYVGVVTVTTVAYLVILIIHLESPKWLLHQNRTDEAITVLNYIAWFNGSDHRVHASTKFIEAKEEHLSTDQTPHKLELKSDSYLISDLNFREAPVF